MYAAEKLHVVHSFMSSFHLPLTDNILVCATMMSSKHCDCQSDKNTCVCIINDSADAIQNQFHQRILSTLLRSGLQHHIKKLILLLSDIQDQNY